MFGEIKMYINRKLYTIYRKVSFPMTLSDRYPGFKDTVVLKGEYLQNDAFYRHSYYRTLIENHIDKLSNGVTFDALEWPVTRISSVVRVCQRQLGFLATAIFNNEDKVFFQALEHRGVNQLFGIHSLLFSPPPFPSSLPPPLRSRPYLPSLSLPFPPFEVGPRKSG